MLPNHPLDAPAAVEPRLGGPVRNLEEEEELQLALTILRINQRLTTLARSGRRSPR
jgi:hypothetical protein